MGSPSSTPTTSRIPSVSVVIPALEAALTLPRAVASIRSQDYPGPVEIVVAVGPSNDETGRVANGLGCLVIDNPTGSTPAALNAAIEASTGAVIVRLDAHAELPTDYVRRAVATLQETGAANVGGVQKAAGHRWFQRAVAMAQTHPLGVGDARYRLGGGRPGPVDTVYLGVFDRTALLAVGGFDERYIRNQDYELNWRLRESGRTVWFEPGLVVSYEPRGSLRDLATQYLEYGRWKRFMLGEHPRAIRPRQLAPPGLILLLASSGLLVWTSGWVGAVAPALYAAALGGTAVVELIRQRDSAALGLPLALATMHLSWGAGFLLGGARR